MKALWSRYSLSRENALIILEAAIAISFAPRPMRMGEEGIGNYIQNIVRLLTALLNFPWPQQAETPEEKRAQAKKAADARVAAARLEYSAHFKELANAK